MDPFSAAASAAGLVSLAFQLFAGCIQGFILLSTAHNLGKDATTILCMLNLQEVHLMEWGRRAGLLEKGGKLDRRLNAKVVEETLQMLQDLMTDTAKLKQKYKLDLQVNQASVEIVPGKDQVLTGVSDETRSEILLRAGLIQSKNAFPRRLWWAAVDKDKIEQLVERIHRFVRELWFLLDPWIQDDSLKSTQAMAAGMILLNNKFDQLKALNEALERWGMMDSENGTHSAFSSLAKSADVKALRVALEDNDDQENTALDNTAQTIPKRQDLLKGLEKLTRNMLSEFTPMKTNKAMGVAQYDQGQVFVEWKEINPHLKRKILPRVDNLAALLNLPQDDTSQSLQCRGTIEAENEIAFIYHYPASGSGDLPKSLRDLFSAKDGIEPPSLTARLQLALSIARKVRQFHRSGWLHKDLRSENILFFPENSNTEEGKYNILHGVLAGFSFARFDSASELSEQPSADSKHDIYRHPSALGEPSESFNATMDAYSLGTILVEIAEWRALKYIVQSVVDVSNEFVPLSKIAQIKPFLLSKKGKGGTSKLETRMGDIYTKACMMCLSGVGDTTSRSATSLLDDAVAELEKCKV